MSGKPRSGSTVRSAGWGQISTRLAKIEGQIAGIGRMVEDGRSHQNVALQIAASISGLQEVAWLMVASDIDATLDPVTTSNERSVVMNTIKTLLRHARRL